MSLASLIRRMADAGASSEVIALAVEEIEALQSSLDARRAADRDRKRAQREREKSANVTGQSEDCRGTVTPISAAKVPSEVSPAPLPTNLQTAPLKSPQKKSVELPDWMPVEEWKAFREMRKSMRSVPFTAAAERGIISDLDKLRGEGHDVAKVLLKAVKGGYRGVFGNEQTKATPPAKPLTDDAARRMESYYIDRGDEKHAAEMRRRYPAAFGQIAENVVKLSRGSAT
jgi:hypothetical protein